MSESKSLESRVSDLEYQAAHVQRLYDQLNEVVTEQSMVIDRLKRHVAKLEEQAKELKQKASTPIDPYDEKPPHY